MLTLHSAKIFMAKEPLDMRKGIDSLAAIVRKQIGQEVYGGHLFLFLSKSRDKAKILFFDEGGFVLYYKRLEKGRFVQPKHSPGNQAIVLDRFELTLLLDGIDINKVKRPKRWIAQNSY